MNSSQGPLTSSCWWLNRSNDAGFQQVEIAQDLAPLLKAVYSLGLAVIPKPAGTDAKTPVKVPRHPKADPAGRYGDITPQVFSDRVPFTV